MFRLICVWIDWVNNREAGDLRRHRAHYDVIVMIPMTLNEVVRFLWPRWPGTIQYSDEARLIVSCKMHERMNPPIANKPTGYRPADLYRAVCLMVMTLYSCNTWWRHQMETFSVLLAICAGNSPGTQRPVTRTLDIFFDLRLNKRLSKQSWGWWFNTLPRPLRRHTNYSCHSRVDIVAFDGMAPVWCQGICNHHVNVGRSSHFRTTQLKVFPTPWHVMGCLGPPSSQICQVRGQYYYQDASHISINYRQTHSRSLETN